jgi:hypothetical protein
MFVGNFAVGFASKQVAPQASLGMLVSYPISHNLLTLADGACS